jgi:hypothetical protein
MKKGLLTLRLFPLAAVSLLAFSMSFSCSTEETPPEEFSLVAEVDKVVDDSSMAAMVLCIPEGELFSISDDSATVTVNDEEVPPSILSYMSTSLAPVDVGDPVELHFAYDGTDFRRTVTMPQKPTITTVDWTFCDPTADIVIEWDPIDPTPDYILITIDYTFTQSGDPYVETVLGTATSFTIPADTLVANGALTVLVAGANTYVSTSEDGFSIVSYIVSNREDVVIVTD